MGKFREKRVDLLGKNRGKAKLIFFFFFLVPSELHLFSQETYLNRDSAATGKCVEGSKTPFSIFYDLFFPLSKLQLSGASKIAIKLMFMLVCLHRFMVYS